MCYLKNLAPQENIDFDDIFQKGEEQSSEQTEIEHQVLIPSPQKYSQPLWWEQQQMLVNLFQMIQRNNCLIKSM